MNDEKRKNARLQGRFSDEPKSSRKEKSKRKSDEATSKRKSLESKTLQPADGVELQYDEQANVPFPELLDKKQSIEINKQGVHVISETENGVSRVIFEPNFLTEDEANHLMTLLKDTTTWYDKNIIIHGQEVPQPRLVAWYGPFPYAYSGAVLDAAEMPPAILEIKGKVEKYLETQQLQVNLNSVLLNLYRDGKDSVAWHSDDELTMGVSPTIASVSLGETRKFQMKTKPHVHEIAKTLVSEEYFVNLTPGSLLIMDGSMQSDWKHQVPKEYHDRKPRINLTFRTVYPIEKVPHPVVVKKTETSNNPPSTKTEEKTHIFDNTNFPSLESANSQNENSSKVFKNPTTKSKSKTVNNTEASLSNQSCSDNSMVVVSSRDENTSDNQELKEESTLCDASSNAVDSDNQTDVVKELSPNNECASISALAGTSVAGQPAAESNQGSKRYELNANADEFIPKCPLLPNDSNDELSNFHTSEYNKQPLGKLPDYFRNNKVPPSRYDEFFSVLVEKLDCNPEFLSDRDYYEVDTLFILYENGLSERNQEVALERLCSMIKNAARLKNRGSYRPPPPRSGYRNTYSRSRGAYKGAANRDRD